MARILLDPLFDHAAVKPVNASHEQQGRKNADSRTDGSSHGTPGQSLALFPICGSIHEQISHQNASHRIQDLLENLGHRGLHHAFVRLKIAPEHAENPAEKNRGSQNAKRQNGVINLNQQPCPEKHK